SNGTATLNADGTLSYAANAGFTGSDSFTYTVSDGSGDTDIATVSVEVTAPPEEEPTPEPDSESVVSLLEEPVVFDGSTVSVLGHQDAFELVDGALSLRFRADGVSGSQGLFSKDSSGFDDGGHLTLTIENGQLKLRAQTTTESLVIEGGRVNAGVVYNVQVTWQAGQLALLLDGEEIGTADGWPGLDANREPIVLGGTQPRSGDGVADRIEDRFSGEILEVTLSSDPAVDPTEPTITNVDPVASDDSGFSVEAGQSIDIAVSDLLANDTDADGDQLSITAVTGGSNNTIVLNADGSINYSAASDAEGADSFIYIVDDGQGGTDTATVTIEVTASSPQPGPDYSTILLSEDFDTAPTDADTVSSSLLLDGGGVALARGADSGTTVFNLVDVAGRTGVVASITMRAPAEGSFDTSGTYRDFIRIEVIYDGGTVTLLDDLHFDRNLGAFVSPTTGNQIGDAFAVLEYAFEAALTAELHITTHVTGDDETIEIDAVQITADPVDESTDSPLPSPPLNAAPFASDDSGFSVEAGQSLDIAVSDLLANDSDVDGDRLSVTAATGGANNIVTLNADGTVSYTPAAGFSGSDTFSYTVSDGQGGTDTATVTIDVTAPASDPTPEPTPEPAPDTVLTLSLLDEALAFDGNTAVVLDHQDAFELADGALSLSFRSDDVQTVQGLFSKDSN
ncbi:MAG: tandem-95 repeat protein, partial [Pseudomonadota bacterium]